MTKVEAIKKVMEDNNGVASWGIIYNNIEKYYPTAKASIEWEAGIRGVLYREIRESRNFKKIGLSVFALEDYIEEKKPDKNDTVRMHSYIEGICIELGNFKKFGTYTADPSAVFKDNIHLMDISALKEIPHFTYHDIIKEVKRIDVIWFNKKGFQFPKQVFEVVDSIGTLTGAFNRSLQLLNFRTDFYIVAPEQHKTKFDQMVHLEPYNRYIDNFKFINYDDIIALYENAEKVNVLENKIF
jgi:hypothetical protein